MKNRRHYYVSNKNLLTWLMVLCMVCSAVTRILFIGVKGADLWSQIVLPITAALLYALITVISGKERFYKTAIPIWLISVYYCFYFSRFNFDNYHVMIVVLYAVMMLFIAVMYMITTSGRLPASWLMVPLLPLPVLAQIYLHGFGNFLEPNVLKLLMPDMLMIGGCLLILLSLHIHTDGAYHPTWGDRSDGRRVRTIPGMDQLSPYIMSTRQGAANFSTDSFEVTHVERYIRAKRREGYSNFGIIHVLLAAYCRGVSKFPAINRFVSGQKIYSRGEDIQFCITVKKELSTDAPDAVVKIHLTPYDTAIDVYNKLNAEIEKAKLGEDDDLDGVINALMSIPGILLKGVVWLLKVLDYCGLLPKALLEVSPFHGSVYFTSMGSLGIPPIYHHLYNFGNLPVFCAFGMKRRVLELQEDGTVVHRKYIDVKMTTDERIVDGFYYATFLKNFRRQMRHPEQLDIPPETIVQDID